MGLCRLIVLDNGRVRRKRRDVARRSSQELFIVPDLRFVSFVEAGRGPERDFAVIRSLRG